MRGVSPAWDCGREPRDVSLLYFLFYIAAAGNEGTPGTLARLLDIRDGAQELRFVGGSQLLAQRIAASLGDRVVLSNPVREIDWTGSNVTVRADGIEVEARRVIVAVPRRLREDRYRPDLTMPRVQLLQRWPMGSLKIEAVYDRPFWRDAGISGNAILTGGPVRSTFDNTPPSGKPGVFWLCRRRVRKIVVVASRHRTAIDDSRKLASVMGKGPSTRPTIRGRLEQRGMVARRTGRLFCTRHSRRLRQQHARSHRTIHWAAPRRPRSGAGTWRELSAPVSAPQQRSLMPFDSSDLVSNDRSAFALRGEPSVQRLKCLDSHVYDGSVMTLRSPGTARAWCGHRHLRSCVYHGGRQTSSRRSWCSIRAGARRSGISSITYCGEASDAGGVDGGARGSAARRRALHGTREHGGQGYILTARRSKEPLRRPIGFAVDTDAKNAGIPQAGLTCAACHTGQVEHRGKVVRIDGGQANIDVIAFGTALAQAVIATGEDPARRRRFTEQAVSLGYPANDIETRFDAFYRRILETRNPPPELARNTPLAAVASMRSAVPLTGCSPRH